MIRVLFSVTVFTGLLLAGCSSSQPLTIQPVKNITAKVKRTFPHAAVSAPQKTRRNGRNYYSYEIRQGKRRQSLTYTQTGIPVERRVGILPSALPKRIQSRLQKLYPDAAVIAVQKTMKGKKTTYYVALKLKGQRFEVMLDVLGRRTLLRA